MDDDLSDAAEETIAGIQSARQDALKQYLEVTDAEPEMVPCDRCESDVWDKRGAQRAPVVERTGYERLCPRCEVALLVAEGHRFESDPSDSDDKTPDEQPAAPDETTEPTPTPDETGAATLGDFA